MVWRGNPGRTCYIKMYDPPHPQPTPPPILMCYFITTQLQIIHSVSKCALLNWHIYKSAAAAGAATGQEELSAKKKKSLLYMSDCSVLNKLMHTHLGGRLSGEVIMAAGTNGVHLIALMLTPTWKEKIIESVYKWTWAEPDPRLISMPDLPWNKVTPPASCCIISAITGDK